MTYALKENYFLSAVTIYRVCNQTDPVSKTAYMQHYTVQYENEELQPFFLDPHRQTMIDLEYCIQKLRDKGHRMMTFIDANEDYFP
jgi:hypothetical protein